MLVLSQDNQYSMANVTVSVTDNTAVQDTAELSTYPIPDFNVLIPTVQDAGPTNTIELFRPGYQATYAALHGMPNAMKYGFGPDFIYDILTANAGVGVYTVNLRGDDATMANVALLLNYEVKKEEQYTDSDGHPYFLLEDGSMSTGYYVDEDGQVQYDSSVESGTLVKRDTLHVSYTTSHFENVKSWIDMVKKLNAFDTSANTDEKGTLPIFGVIYRGASDFGNNSYFSMNAVNAEYDGNTYYAVTAYDGLNTYTTEANMSLDVSAGSSHGANYFIENVFNSNFNNLRFSMYENIQLVYDLYKKYLITGEDFAAGRTEASIDFAEIDPFSYNGFAITVDDGSLNVKLANAFKLVGGSDGTADADSLYREFFAGEILDARSVIRYRVNYVPDIGYSDETKKALIDYVKVRNRFTTSTVMVGDTTFRSALLDHSSNYYENMPCVRQIAKAQSPMMYNPYCRRTLTYPATYFDTMEWVRVISANGHPYQPFAGANVRWRGFIEDTMVYPTENAEFIQSLTKARINFVMKDNAEGAYMSDQQMNTEIFSDQTEFNNSLLITSMLYDLLALVHENHFKFNESQDVKTFKTLVDEFINNKYARYSAALDVDVYRMGTVGRAAQTNKIVVVIDLKDINRFTNIELILTDN